MDTNACALAVRHLYMPGVSAAGASGLRAYRCCLSSPSPSCPPYSTDGHACPDMACSSSPSCTHPQQSTYQLPTKQQQFLRQTTTTKHVLLLLLRLLLRRLLLPSTQARPRRLLFHHHFHLLPTTSHARRRQLPSSSHFASPRVITRGLWGGRGGGRCDGHACDAS